MRCYACGAEHENFIQIEFVKDVYLRQNSRQELYDDSPEYGYLYACPSCGTLKIEVD